MRQVRITTKNLDYPQHDDCLIPDDDPIHAMKKNMVLGGLGSGIELSPEMAALIKKYWKEGDGNMAKM
jgi:hypothetical protein